MEKQLPKNWVETELKDILSYVIGGDWGKDPESIIDDDFTEVLCIRGSEIKKWNDNKGNTASLRKIKKSSLENRKLVIGDILVEISGGGPDQPVGRTVLIDEKVLNFESETPKVCTNFLRLLRIYGNLNSVYINHYFHYFYDIGEIVKYQGGSNNLRNLKFKEFETIQIPLPPLPEQHRIVAKLDTFFSQLETIKTSMANIPLLLKDFRQQVLTQAVTGKLTEEWRKGKELERTIDTTIGQLFEVKTGSTPKRGTSIYYDNATIPWLKSGQVRNEFIYEADEFITEIAVKDTNAKIYPVDSILVAMYGEGKTRGQVGWTKIEAASNQAIAALVNINMKLVTKKYVYNFCLSQYNEIRAQAEGGNQPNLNLSKIKNWKIKLPSDIEQQEIVSRVESLFAKADAIEQQYKTLKACIDNVPQAILHKAFKGELSEQLESDGDARELLQQIQQLKEATTKAGKNIKSKTQISKAKKVKNYPENEEVLRMVAEHQ